MPRSDNYTGRLRVTGEISATNVINYGFTGEIIHRGVISKDANYAVPNSVSGAIIIANNSAQPIFFTLPPVNAANGRIWDFFNANTGIMQIVGDTNALVTTYGSADKAANFGISPIKAAQARVAATASKYYLLTQMEVNTATNIYLQG